MTPTIQKITVRDNELSPKHIIAGTRGSYGITQLNFALSPEWEGASCIVTFHPRRGKPVSIPWAGVPIDIPVEIMKYSGVSGYVFSGTIIEEGVAEAKNITLPGEINVLFTLDDEGGNTTGFTPAIHSLILAMIGKLGDLKTEAKENLVAAINEALESSGASVDEETVKQIIKEYLIENPIEVKPYQIGGGLALDEATNTLSAEIRGDSFAEIPNTKVQEIFNKVMQEA